MENGLDAQGIPVFPPRWFAENVNMARNEAGLPPLGRLDPLVMGAWLGASGWGKPPPPLAIILTGV
jgi:hypothetical protein